jgi:hypothetical protein
VVLVAAALAGAGTVVAAPAPLEVACSAERPTARAGEVVGLRAWAVATGRSLTYAWSSPTGRLEASGAEARWLLADAPAGPSAATVRVTDARGQVGECVVRVVVAGTQRSRGGPAPAPALPRETGRSPLLPSDRERDGYGLYSYLLLGAPPGEADRPRILEALTAFAAVVPEIDALERYVPRRELNIAYLPLTETPAPGATAQWLLDHYDFARARSLLRLAGGGRDGPYFVSALRPLSPTSTVRPILLQDLSTVPAHLVAPWVKEFLNQAAQERFWEEKTGRQLVGKMRLTVAVLAVGLPEVRKALDDWITWLR